MHFLKRKELNIAVSPDNVREILSKILEKFYRKQLKLKLTLFVL